MTGDPRKRGTGEPGAGGPNTSRRDTGRRDTRIRSTRRRNTERRGTGGRGAPPLLVGVGVGPGDPELLTVKAVNVLTSADVVFVPVLDPAEEGRAEATVRAHVPHGRIRRVAFSLGEEHGGTDRAAAWRAAAGTVSAAFAAGARRVAFATIGDPNIYSTFTYLADAVRARVAGLTVETVPGITAMQDLAARSGTVLCEGTETLALVPMTAGVEAFAAALATFDTVVAYKGGRRLPDMLAAIDAAGRLDTAVYGARLGLPTQEIRPAGTVEGAGPYLSTVLVPAARHRDGAHDGAHDGARDRARGSARDMPGDAVGGAAGRDARDGHRAPAKDRAWARGRR